MVLWDGVLSLKPRSDLCCVDCCVQGMDPVNERRVFDLIVAASSQENESSQYFILTPKVTLHNTSVKVSVPHAIFTILANFMQTDCPLS